MLAFMSQVRVLARSLEEAGLGVTDDEQADKLLAFLNTQGISSQRIRDETVEYQDLGMIGDRSLCMLAEAAKRNIKENQAEKLQMIFDQLTS